MSRRTIRAIAGMAFLVCFAVLLHDAKLEPQDDARWVSQGIGRVVVWVLVGSAVGYLAARKKAGPESS